MADEPAPTPTSTAGPISTNTGDAPRGSRNLLDFIDMVLDREGRPYVAYADGCTGNCASYINRTMDMSRSAQGMVLLMETGPSLLLDEGRLGPLTP